MLLLLQSLVTPVFAQLFDCGSEYFLFVCLKEKGNFTLSRKNISIYFLASEALVCLKSFGGLPGPHCGQCQGIRILPELVCVPIKTLTSTGREKWNERIARCGWWGLAPEFVSCCRQIKPRILPFPSFRYMAGLGLRRLVLSIAGHLLPPGTLTVSAPVPSFLAVSSGASSAPF